MKALIVKNDKLLVVKQRIGEKLLYDLPGGRVKHAETPFESLEREVQEETGIRVNIIEPVGVWWFFRMDGDQVVCTTFRCEPLAEVKAVGSIEDEFLVGFSWITKEEFLSDAYPVSHKSLKELVSNVEF